VKALALFAAAAALLTAQEVRRPRITGLAHIAIYAADYEKSRAFYRGFLDAYRKR
jgi:hypothetical protein